jgi:cytidylate kinase
MVVTVSREAEAGGEDVARLVADAAGLHIADRAILERIAQQEGAPISHLLRFDEAMPGTIEALIAEWQTSMSHATYLRRLINVLLLLEREDNVLIIGRGGAFVLTDPGTFHARVTAPMPCRVARIVQREGVPAGEAERALRRIDEEKARFVEQSFGADIALPTHYDLTINTAELGIETAAELVIRAARQKATRRRISSESPEDFLSHLSHFRRRPRLPRVSEVTWEYCRRRRVV